jgi:DNA-binding transcriptional MerR regulator
MGLVAAPERSEGNQRRYSRQELERLAFIRHARDLGFAVEDIRALIDLSGHPEQPCGHADKIAQEQLISVREKIAQLKRLETELERIASCCDGKTVGDCYVIRALSDHALCADEHVS